MRFGGILALASFAYVILSGLVQGTTFSPLLQQGLVVLVVFYVFGTIVGQIGEAVAVEEIDRVEAAVEADIVRIQRETEEIAGVSRFREQSVPVMTPELQPGQILAEDVRNTAGEVLFRAASPVTDSTIRRLIEEGVRKVQVQRACQPA